MPLFEVSEKNINPTREPETSSLIPLGVQTEESVANFLEYNILYLSTITYSQWYKYINIKLHIILQ